MPTTSKSPFRLAVSREPTPLSQVLPTTSPRFPLLQEGGRVEISQESWKISRKVGQLIAKGGAGLYVDYGGPQMFGNSFRVSPHLISLTTIIPGTHDYTQSKGRVSTETDISGIQESSNSRYL